jgi:hypothetical protein
MKRYCALLLLTLSIGHSGVARARPTEIEIIVGPDAPQLERLAAEELRGYAERVFDATVSVGDTPRPGADFSILVGSPHTNPATKALNPAAFGPAGDQTILLLPAQWHAHRALVVGGRTPRATYWAVSRLAEHWGIRHLLGGDVFPERRQFRFEVPELVASPNFQTRGWRVINDFAYGTESWGMRDYRPLLHQLAKLGFNRIYISIYPWQPFLDLEIGGIRRKSAALWYGFHYPITADMVGRSLFGDTTEFWNPDLPMHASYSEMAAAGRALVNAIVAESHRFGMECVLSATLTSFPREFAPLLKSSRALTQLGGMDIVPGPDTGIDDPALQKLAAAVLKTTVDTYPEVDAVSVAMPEHRDWVEQYEAAWRALDARYGIEKAHPLAEILRAAAHRPDYPGGTERAVREVKGDIAALYFMDRLIRDAHALRDSRRPGMPLIYVGIAEELQPVLQRILRPGTELMAFIDYTPGRVLRRPQALKGIGTSGIASTLIYTLEDDNVGPLPQLNMNSIAQLNQELHANHWSGFVTRCWLAGDREPAAAYLARSAWDIKYTRDAAYRDYLQATWGDAAVEPALEAFHRIEAATEELGWHGLGFAFAIPDMFMKHWKPEPLAPELVAAGRHYQEALDIVRPLLSQTRGAPTSESRYWTGRLRFATGYFEAVEALSAAAQADAVGDRARAMSLLATSLKALTEGVTEFAAVARDQSDRGAIAILNEYAVRPLRAKAASYDVAPNR